MKIAGRPEEGKIRGTKWFPIRNSLRISVRKRESTEDVNAITTVGIERTLHRESEKRKCLGQCGGCAIIDLNPVRRIVLWL